MHKKLMRAYDETKQYFRELFEHKRRLKNHSLSDPDSEGMDLMG